MHFRLIEHGEVDSTSERAFESINKEKARHEDVHVALAQTEGRGRRGRSWDSPSGQGLYASLVLLPEPPPLKPAALTMAVGLAVLDALIALGLEGARLDWPNDVVVEGAKIAGILVESRGLNDEAPHYVVGMGINARQRSFPDELVAEREVTSLALQGVEALPRAVLQAVLAHLPARLIEVRSHHRRLARQYLSETGLAGQKIRLETGSELWRGRVVDLTLSGGLEIELFDGSRHKLPLEFVRKLERD